ncbi:hypothetical protein DYH09_24000 [bacterium CPR1]|nr:hypothetical protein [bacterium CPR1]
MGVVLTVQDYWRGQPIRVVREDGFEAWFRPDWSYQGTLRRAAGQFESPLPQLTLSWPQRLRTAVIQARRGLEKLYRDAFTCDIWAVGWARHRLQSLSELPGLDWQWRPEPGPLTYEADPFAFRHQGAWHLVVEEHRHGKPARLVESTEHGRRIPRLEGAHHSFPYLFTWQDQDYCLPESLAERRLKLYRLHDGLQLERVLLENVEVVDPVMFEHQGLWWLLYTGPSQHGAYRLHAAHASSPLGPFQSHALDPLKQDIRSTRSAGKPFRLNGRLYRPAQDCSRSYGDAVIVQEVLELTPETFHEVPVLKLEPRKDSPYRDGLHHLVVEDDLVLIDARRIHHDPFWLVRR